MASPEIDTNAICEALKEAEVGLREATTADDVRAVWPKHLMTLGHRRLGKMLLGSASAEDLAARMGVVLE